MSPKPAVGATAWVTDQATVHLKEGRIHNKAEGVHIAYLSIDGINAL
jgi:hypothetical protein